MIEWLRRVISIVACCHSAKLCTHAARDFRSKNGAVTRMWRSWRVQPSHKERAIGSVRCKKEGMLLQPLRWCWVYCVIHHWWDVREEQQYIYVARTSNNREIAAHDLYCCLLPQCEALLTCRSGFPIATPYCPSAGSDSLYLQFKPTIWTQRCLRKHTNCTISLQERHFPTPLRHTENHQFYWNTQSLDQRGPTTFDLRAIFGLLPTKWFRLWNNRFTSFN